MPGDRPGHPLLVGRHLAEDPGHLAARPPGCRWATRSAPPGPSASAAATATTIGQQPGVHGRHVRAQEHRHQQGVARGGQPGPSPPPAPGALAVGADHQPLARPRAGLGDDVVVGGAGLGGPQHRPGDGRPQARRHEHRHDRIGVARPAGSRRARPRCRGPRAAGPPRAGAPPPASSPDRRRAPRPRPPPPRPARGTRGSARGARAGPPVTTPRARPRRAGARPRGARPPTRGPRPRARRWPPAPRARRRPSPRRPTCRAACGRRPRGGSRRR